MSGDTCWNVLMVGVGGQGIVTSSDILARAAMEAGYDAKKSEIHGMSQRGGSVFAHVRFGAVVWSPTVPRGRADILLSLEEMETIRWLGYAGPETKIIVANARILPANTEVYPEGALAALRAASPEVVVADVAALEARVGDRRYLNVALLGVVSGSLRLPLEAWKKAIEAEVPKRHIEANWKAFEAGRES